WTLTEALVCEHATDLADKIVIDATNPLNPAMTGLALGFLTSGVELLQSQARQAKFFKTFNSAGVGVLARPDFAEGKAAMLVAGPHGPDKKIVMRLITDVGFEPIDAGELKAARLLEPLAMLTMQLALGKGDVAFVMAVSRERITRPAGAPWPPRRPNSRLAWEMRGSPSRGGQFVAPRDGRRTHN